MRRRAMMEGHIWLERNGLELAEGRILGQTAASVGFQSAIEYLTRKLGMLLHFEQRDGWYYLQCFPRRVPGGWQGPAVAASYKGRCLGSIPDAARLDYTQLLDGQCRPLYSAREIPREVI